MEELAALCCFMREVELYLKPKIDAMRTHCCPNLQVMYTSECSSGRGTGLVVWPQAYFSRRLTFRDLDSMDKVKKAWDQVHECFCSHGGYCSYV